MAGRRKAWFYGLSLVGIAGSNLECLFWVMCGVRGLRDGPIAHPDESHWSCRHRPSRGYRALETRKESSLRHISSRFLSYICMIIQLFGKALSIVVGLHVLFWKLQEWRCVFIYKVFGKFRAINVHISNSSHTFYVVLFFLCFFRVTHNFLNNKPVTESTSSSKLRTLGFLSIV
jgi:hypothetical protein